MDFKSLKDKLSRGKRDFPMDSMESNMPDGSTVGYRPGRTSRQDPFRTQRQMAAVPAQEPAMPMGRPADLASQFVDINATMAPGASRYGEGLGGFQRPGAAQEPTGYQQPWGFQQPNMGGQTPTGFQPTMGGQAPTGFQPTMGGQAPTAFQPMAAAPQPTGYQPQAQGYQPPAAPNFAQPQPMGAQRPANGFFPGSSTPQQTPPRSQPSNITPMPGLKQDAEGRAYRHVERIVQLTGLRQCFRIMEYMRNGESVVVITENIANMAEVQRCQDLLSGAAFSLNCSMTKLSSQRYNFLIAPNAVYVAKEDSNRWSHVEQPPRESEAPQAPQQQAPQPMPAGGWNQTQFTAQQNSGYAPAPQQTQWQQPQYTNRQQGLSDRVRSFFGNSKGQNAPAAGDVYDYGTRKGFYGVPRADGI